MNEVVSTWWFRLSVLALYECPSEGNDQQVLDVPQAVARSIRFCASIECMQLGMEFLFVKQMDQLTAMKLDCIDQKYCIVDTGDDGRIRFGKTTSTILKFTPVSKILQLRLKGVSYSPTVGYRPSHRIACRLQEEGYFVCVDVQRSKLDRERTNSMRYRDRLS